MGSPFNEKIGQSAVNFVSIAIFQDDSIVQPYKLV